MCKYTIRLGNADVYKLTATIAKIFLETQSECGIVYPAIAMRANAENFAFTTQLADNQLQLENVKWIKINKIQDIEQHTVTVLECATSFNKDGQINWRLPTKEEAERL